MPRVVNSTKREYLPSAHKSKILPRRIPFYPKSLQLAKGPASITMQLKNIIGFVFGPVSSAVLGLVTVPLAAWVFSPADLGRLNIMQVAMSFALLSSVLGLDQAYVREHHEAKDKEQLLLICFAPGFLLLVISGGAAALFAPQISSLLYADTNVSLFVYTLILFYIGHVCRFLSLTLRMEEHGWAYSVSQLIPKLVYTAAIVLLASYPFHKEFIHLLLCTVLSSLAMLIALAWMTRRQLLGAARKKMDYAKLKALMPFSIPLVFSGLAYWGLTATSTMSLSRWSTLDELAIFSVGNSFASVAVVFQSIFSVIWAPLVYKWLANEKDMSVIDQTSQQVLAFVCALIAVCGSLSWLCTLFLPAHYKKVEFLLPCLLLPPLLYILTETTSMGINIRRKTYFSLINTFAAFFITVVAAWALVPLHGAAGAASANAVAFTAYFIFQTEVSNRIWRSSPRLELYAYVTGLLALSLASAFCPPDSRLILHSFWGLILLLIVMKFKPQLIGMFRLFSKK